MDNHIITLIKSCHLFAPLDEQTLQSLLPQFTETFLKKDEILFHQGDSSHDLYLLIQGTLSAVLTTYDNEKKFIGIITPGETVGELGALAMEPRSLTVRAIEDSLLLKLSNETFKDICFRFPTMIMETLNPLIKRSRNILQLLSEEKKTHANIIIPANSEVDLTLFLEMFFNILKNKNNIVLITESFIQQQGEDKLLTLIQEALKHHKKILFFPATPSSILFKMGLFHTNSIYIATHHNASLHIDPLLIKQLTENQIKPNLILLHDDSVKHPKYTFRWLNLLKVGLHHHVKLNKKSHYERLIRFLFGNAYGLVLSGGGARGWAHVGVIKAFKEHHIPIDIIGGTSSGAIAASCYALHMKQYDEFVDTFSEIVEAARSTPSFKNLTWPAIALFNCKEYTEIQQSIMSDTRIEDLWIPFFCISCNLSKSKEAVHQQGLLWEKIRASVAIPGVIPPVIIDGELHFDGGLMNNVPTDIMRKLVGPFGQIIAVNTESNHIDYTRYEFPPILTLKQTLLAKLKLGYRDYKFPPFLDTFLKSLMVGSSAKTTENLLIANQVISPNLSRFEMLSTSNKEDKKIIEYGYQAALRMIQQGKIKKPEIL